LVIISLVLPFVFRSRGVQSGASSKFVGYIPPAPETRLIGTVT
jgi:hypothetical protein